MLRPHHLSRRQTIIALSIILAAMGIGVGVLLTNQLKIGQPSMPTPSITPGAITIEGRIVCLPHKDTTGPQTLECAFGLQSEAGDYYGLRNLKQDQLIDGTLSVSTKVKVKGSVVAPSEDERYGVLGNINIESIEVISSSANRVNLDTKYVTFLSYNMRGPST